MKAIRFVLAALALSGLAGCFTSDKPLVTNEDSATPYQKITFYNENDEAMVYALDGKRYMATDDKGEVSYLNLKQVDADTYVAQLTSAKGDSSGPQILYGFMQIDANAKKARLWKMVGTKADVRPGLRECNDVVCIDDLNAYIDYAKASKAAGDTPDSEMKIDLE
jgi:hypothetical protein